MPVIRKKLAPSDVYPENIRYNEVSGGVESLINGEWVENENADPRKQTSYPPRVTSDPSCDAAQSVVDALKATIDSTIEAVENAGTAATIAGIILSLFTFGVFAIFITIALFIAHAMLDAGYVALEAALTPTVYDTLKCILNCHMDSEGRISEAELDNVYSEVTDQIGGLGATILNAMLSLAGEGGINNLASLGTSTGDCSECDCYCGFTTSQTEGNLDMWELATDIRDTVNFPTPVFNVNPASANIFWANGYCNAPNNQLCFVHEFPDSCFVENIDIYNAGESSSSRMLIATRSGGVWTIHINQVSPNHSSGTPWHADVDNFVDAVQIQFNGCNPTIRVIGVA